MRALALDVGTRRIGLAVGDTETGFASAAGVLERGGHEVDARAVLERARAEAVDCLVIGLPLELDGSEGHRVRLVRRFVEVLETVVRDGGDAFVLELWDERFSTAAAERTLQEAELSREARKRKVDALAAQFFLQGWIDARRRA
jgi:putative Holliday junction resolvase